MIFRVLTIFGYCLILAACSTTKDNSEQSQFALMENTIFQNAKKNGLKKTDITIYRRQTFLGNHYAIVKCNNSQKCKNSEIVIPVSKINSYSVRSYNYSPNNKARGSSPSYINTGNPGPGFSPYPNNN